VCRTGESGEQRDDDTGDRRTDEDDTVQGKGLLPRGRDVPAV
jgi:hypothetical protein